MVIRNAVRKDSAVCPVHIASEKRLIVFALLRLPSSLHCNDSISIRWLPSRCCCRMHRPFDTSLNPQSWYTANYFTNCWFNIKILHYQFIQIILVRKFFFFTRQSSKSSKSQFLAKEKYAIEGGWNGKISLVMSSLSRGPLGLSDTVEEVEWPIAIGTRGYLRKPTWTWQETQ